MIWNFLVSAVRIRTWNSWHLRTEDLAYAMDVLRQTLVPSPVETAGSDVVYPVDGYDGETSHAAMLLVMPTKRTGWKAKTMGHFVVSIELGLSVGPIRQWEMLQAGSKNTAFGSTSFLLCNAEKQDLHPFLLCDLWATRLYARDVYVSWQALRLAFLLHFAVRIYYLIQKYYHPRDQRHRLGWLHVISGICSTFWRTRQTIFRCRTISCVRDWGSLASLNFKDAIVNAVILLDPTFESKNQLHQLSEYLLAWGNKRKIHVWSQANEQWKSMNITLMFWLLSISFL